MGISKLICVSQDNFKIYEIYMKTYIVGLAKMEFARLHMEKSRILRWIHDFFTPDALVSSLGIDSSTRICFPLIHQISLNSFLAPSDCSVLNDFLEFQNSGGKWESEFGAQKKRAPWICRWSKVDFLNMKIYTLGSKV